MRFWLAVAFVPSDQLIPLARAAEDAGFEGITISDHLLYPHDLRSKYPYSADGAPPFGPDSPWPDPWVAIGAMAAVTSRLRFATNVYVAPARDVFTVAKAVATAAVLSGGRVLAGLAAGWMREEFDATGQSFGARGDRLDELIAALRLLWLGDWAEFHGRHVDFDAVRIAPAPGRPIPILVGGQSSAALRRAARLGDGWIANALTIDQAEDALRTLTTLRREAGTANRPFEVIAPVMARPDADIVQQLEGLGLTGMIVAPWAGDGPSGFGSPLDAKIAGIERFGGTEVRSPG